MPAFLKASLTTELLFPEIKTGSEGSEVPEYIRGYWEHVGNVHWAGPGFIGTKILRVSWIPTCFS